MTLFKPRATENVYPQLFRLCWRLDKATPVSNRQIFGGWPGNDTHVRIFETCPSHDNLALAIKMYHSLCTEVTKYAKHYSPEKNGCRCVSWVIGVWDLRIWPNSSYIWSFSKLSGHIFWGGLTKSTQPKWVVDKKQFRWKCSYECL